MCTRSCCAASPRFVRRSAAAPPGPQSFPTTPLPHSNLPWTVPFFQLLETLGRAAPLMPEAKCHDAAELTAETRDGSDTAAAAAAAAAAVGGVTPSWLGVEDQQGGNGRGDNEDEGDDDEEDWEPPVQAGDLPLLIPFPSGPAASATGATPIDGPPRSAADLLWPYDLSGVTRGVRLPVPAPRPAFL